MNNSISMTFNNKELNTKTSLKLKKISWSLGDGSAKGKKE